MAELLSVEEQIRQMENLGRTDNQGYLGLTAKRNQLQYDLKQLADDQVRGVKTGEKDLQGNDLRRKETTFGTHEDIVNNIIDSLLYDNLRGQVVGTETVRKGNRGVGASSGYRTEGVPTGELDADGNPIYTTPSEPTSVPEEMKGFLVNPRREFQHR